MSTEGSPLADERDEEAREGGTGGVGRKKSATVDDAIRLHQQRDDERMQAPRIVDAAQACATEAAVGKRKEAARYGVVRRRRRFSPGAQGGDTAPTRIVRAGMRIFVDGP